MLVGIVGGVFGRLCWVQVIELRVTLALDWAECVFLNLDSVPGLLGNVNGSSDVRQQDSSLARSLGPTGLPGRMRKSRIDKRWFRWLVKRREWLYVYRRVVGTEKRDEDGRGC